MNRALLLLPIAAAMLSGCSTDATMASRNLSKAAEMLSPGHKPVIKAMDGKQTIFPNEKIKEFVKHYDKATEFSSGNISALNTFLRTGSFIEEKPEGAVS